MNDLDLVRGMRAGAGYPTPARMAAGRDQILAAASRPRRYRRLALPVGAVTAAAAVASGAGFGGTATPSNHPRPAPVAQVSLAARILTVAARTVAAEPSARPGDRQWVYARFVQTQTGQATQSDENWVRFDARVTRGAERELRLQCMPARDHQSLA